MAGRSTENAGIRIFPPNSLPNQARSPRPSPVILSGKTWEGGMTGRVASRLEIWARAERQAVNEEVKYFKAGGKAISPSGDDITRMKLEELGARLEGVNLALKEIEDAARQ